MARGCWTGLVSAAGAVIAHGYAAGGDFSGGAFVAVGLITAVAVAVSCAVARRVNSGWVPVVVALAVQGAAHLALAGGSHHHPSGPNSASTLMLTLHLSVAALAAGLALGGDRVLVRAAAAAVLSWLHRVRYDGSPLIAAPLREVRPQVYRIHASTGVVTLRVTRGPPRRSR
ncbi:hypothetical protein [Nocardioides sp. R-C-SC26]|uniref:hypothetical protein n=1 Tax=Nocardioides sp. R-C-SC26 TaxID=2870414 RepID=UPI001E2D6B6C|nr:hypothetical protein [Nocardioides sp. R-C-SC26]